MERACTKPVPYVWIKGRLRLPCECAFQTSGSTYETNNSRKHLRDSIGVTEQQKKLMPVEHARNLFKLSEALRQEDLGDEDEADDHRDDAEVFLHRRDPDAVETGPEEDYDKYILIFWR